MDVGSIVIDCATNEFSGGFSPRKDTNMGELAQQRSSREEERMEIILETDPGSHLKALVTVEIEAELQTDDILYG
jgi:hypothetical protein